VTGRRVVTVSDRVTLHEGDALAVLASLPSASVDVVLTDPPYSSGGMVRGDRVGSTAAKYLSASDLPDFSGDTRDGRSYGYWCSLWLGELLRVVKPGGLCGLFTDWRQLPTTTDALQAGGWVWRGVVPWHKPAGRPHLGRWVNACEYLVWGTAGPRELAGAPFPGFYTGSPPRDREHQTQKPVEVIRDMLAIAPPGGVVLDPFMGSGTTGVAAVARGLRFVGIEQVPHFVDVAERRIREALGHAVERDGQAALDLSGAGS